MGILFLSPYELHGDEAQYWAWSKDLDWGYFTKPPGIAALIATTTSLFGDAEWAARIGSPLVHSLTAYIIFRTGRFLYSGATGFWAAAFYLLMPALWLSSHIISTDVPLLFCWALALNGWAHLRVQVSWLRAAQLGLALGLGVLSKYAMLFFLPALILVMIIDRPTRRAILTLKGLLALFIFLACIAPNLYWNYLFDFATLTHTAANADFEGGRTIINPLKFIEFWAGQFAVFGPVSLILFFLAVRAVKLKRLQSPSICLAIFSITPLIVISVQALLSRADLNWAVTAYIGASILTAHYSVVNWDRFKNLVGRNLIIQTTICLMAAALYMMPNVVNALGRANDVKRLRGWEATVQLLSDRFADGHEGQPFQSIALDKRMHFYALNFYGLSDKAPIYMWMYQPYPDNNHAEITHPLGPTSGPVLIVNYHQKDKYKEALNADFSRLIPLPDLDLDLGGGKRRVLSLWAGYDYRPTKEVRE